ncbi:hypothetical protein [Luteibacter sp. ME-Dv--P-043b]|uniref:hypothetical protein n=1 Tax=Luteibacter sp. ME-Dv--P-043b TaxID=3040291 RepID=UPI00255235D8|nr:hypothetical protein [Luteibacter sp. ME-Dv--P-043b]
MTLQSVVPIMPALQVSKAVATSARSGQGPSISPRDLVGPRLGILADEPVTDALAGAQEGVIPPQGRRDLMHLVILTGDAGAMLEADSDRMVLTGIRGARNDCRLLLRQAYGTVRCEVQSTGAEVHLGFLSWRHGAFEEVQTIHIQRRPVRGYQGGNGGRLITIVEYRAEPLREVHGLVWRGGLLRIESLCLTP